MYWFKPVNNLPLNILFTTEKKNQEILPSKTVCIKLIVGLDIFWQILSENDYS